MRAASCASASETSTSNFNLVPIIDFTKSALFVRERTLPLSPRRLVSASCRISSEKSTFAGLSPPRTTPTRVRRKSTKSSTSANYYRPRILRANCRFRSCRASNSADAGRTPPESRYNWPLRPNPGRLP
jgi:hypothetical protein